MNKLFITYIISLLLAAFGIIFRQSKIYAYSLIGLAITLFCIAIIITFIGLFQKFRFIIYLDKDKAFNAAKSIFKNAANNGGDLYATHIFPRNESTEAIKDDLAIKELNNINPDHTLSFSRILIVSNFDIERQWVSELFSNISENTKLKLHILGSYPIVLPRLIHAIIPRINLILYKHKNQYDSLIGLDELYIVGLKKKINFALRTRNNKVFNTLYSYFDSLLAFGQIKTISSKYEYDSAIQKFSHVPIGAHVAIQAIIRIAELSSIIFHVVIFGSVAKQINGYLTVSKKEHDNDIDLLIVYDNKCTKQNLEELKNQIQKELPPSEFNIVWGPDKSFFYPWREQSKTSVDIELISCGSSFYADNPLLGTSIFEFCNNIYSKPGVVLCDSLQMPRIMTERERWSVFMNDRLGLKDIKTKITKYDDKYDPRRVMNIVVRNIVWAVSGKHAMSAAQAISIIQKKYPKIIMEDKLRGINESLNEDMSTISANFKEYKQFLEEIIDEIIAHSHKMLKRKPA